MNKEFIPYEQALELKGLGFNEYCFKTSWDFDITDKVNVGLPLYQQTFRWFRDVHGLNGVIEGSKKYGFEWCIFPDIDYYMKPPNNFNTYEDAELACLKKLIEIVKNK